MVGDLQAEVLERRIREATLQELPGIGPVTAGIIVAAADGQRPVYLTRLLDEAAAPEPTAMRAALRGDCHTHSDWSDGAARRPRWRRPPVTSGTSGSR